MLKKQYYMPYAMPFTEEKQDRIIGLFENPEIIRRNHYRLELREESNPARESLTIVYRPSHTYLTEPQYEIEVKCEEENFGKILEKIEQILGVS